jgi:hypothetical protein
MMSEVAENAARAFLAERVKSVAQLELILLLSREPQRAWGEDEAARVFGLSPEMTGQLLAELCREGLASVEDATSSAASRRYHYAPSTPEVDRRVQQLAALYRERRATVIQWIYGPPIDKLQSFADAFDLRKPKEND